MSGRGGSGGREGSGPGRRSWALGAVLALGLLALAPSGDEGPDPLPFAVHRIDMAMVGVAVALWGVAVPARQRRRRAGLAAHLARGLRLRLALLVSGVVLLHLGAAAHSRDWWEYSVFSMGFHLLGPARVLGEQSLLLSGLGLSCTCEVVNHLLATKAFGATGVVYVLASVDAVVLALLGMAGERGLPPFQVFQVVSRVGWTTAAVSVPLAIYGGRLGYWGAEPFAWLFALLSLGLLVAAAVKEW